MSFFAIRRIIFFLMTFLTVGFCIYLVVLIFDYSNDLTLFNKTQQEQTIKILQLKNAFPNVNNLNVYHEIDIDFELRELGSINSVLESSYFIENGAEKAFLIQEAESHLKELKQRIEEKFNIALLKNQQNGFDQFSIYFSLLIHRLVPLIIGYILGMLVVSLLGIYITSEILKKALKKLSFGVKKIREGDLSFRFESGRLDDEIESVKLDFNIMSQYLSLQKRQLKKTHDTLLQTLMRLQNSNAYKDQFLANMSHELRTPLSALIGFSEIIQQKGIYVGDEKLKQYATTMIQSSEHLLSLISRLLEVAQLSAEQYQPQKEQVNINEVATTVVAMLLPLAHKNNNLLCYENELEDEYCICVKLAIQQILVNLLQNAIKFTHNGKIKLTVFNQDDECIISVQDTGIGIDTKDQENLFIDFYRAESSYTSQTQGVGLGLTIVRKWVDFHSGRIILKSQKNEGSLFEVHLPNQGEEK